MMPNLASPQSGVIWRDGSRTAGVCFIGKAGLSLSDAAEQCAPAGRLAAWLEQVHGRTARLARPGWSGRGDALISTQHETVPIVMTADCVPVLLAADRSVAAVHAGWRGIAQEVVARAAERMVDDPPHTAWIGPAIGRCCYEVSEAVARAVADASTDESIRTGPRSRPHLDLTAAVVSQLEDVGVKNIRCVDWCTRCHADRLWSYRREGAGAGRNLAMIWLRANAADC